MARRLSKVARLRIGMFSALAVAVIAAGAYLALPYIQSEASADVAMSYRSDVEVEIEDVEADLSVAESAETAPAEVSDGISYPEIDWEGLLEENPNVIAWLYVPGTRVDYAVVQASVDDPQHYLNYDLAGKRSNYGCPYLDSTAARQGGVNSLFPIIYGHHLVNGKMFSDFAKFAKKDYASEHSQILLMTPQGNRELRAVAVNVLNASKEKVRTVFSDRADLEAYLSECLESCEVILETPEAGSFERVFCFVTCSYGSSNERTVVYAVDDSAAAPPSPIVAVAPSLM